VAIAPRYSKGGQREVRLLLRPLRPAASTAASVFEAERFKRLEQKGNPLRHNGTRKKQGRTKRQNGAQQASMPSKIPYHHSTREYGSQMEWLAAKRACMGDTSR